MMRKPRLNSTRLVLSSNPLARVPLTTTGLLMDGFWLGANAEDCPVPLPFCRYRALVLIKTMFAHPWSQGSKTAFS
ncbi:hypothetical protein HDF08_003542 [Edaphobacter lichenicola]|uniref:Uncharacterized protein n=1 Tax=Tunturiibacter lichenicola TaxID=2051959 RepID=A0A852VIH9_9BACT|nr:hypothetical protein [Edaphobacter lichenicola]